MERFVRKYLMIAGIILGAASLGGCDGATLDIEISGSADIGDTPGFGGGNDDDGGGVPITPPGGGGDDNGGGDEDGTARFRGQWIAAYEDDQVDDSLDIGFTQYAVVMTIAESNGLLSGTGRLRRLYLGQTSADEEVDFRLEGETRGDRDATITWTAVQATDFELPPTWFLRISGNRMVGIFIENEVGGTLGRSGHTTWFRTTDTPLLTRSWAAAFEDATGTEGFPRRDRVAQMDISTVSDGPAGGGSMRVIRPNDVPNPLSFSVAGGSVAGNFADFAFVGSDIATNPFEWDGFFSDDVVAAVYSQFNVTPTQDVRVRFGHALWHDQPNSGPDALNGRWVGAFSDDNAPGGEPPADYLAAMTLSVEDGGAVDGSSITVFNRSRNNPGFTSYDLEAGQLFGTRVAFDLVSTNDAFIWDFRLAGSLLIGAYQRVDSSGAFLSRGTAVFRRANTNTVLRGGWVTSYFDTTNDTGDRVTQLARIAITDQDNQGNFVGNGFIRFANSEQGNERTFTLSGQIQNSVITMTWEGGGLVNATEWTLRRSNGGLHGAYENLLSTGALESRGSAFWRSTTTQR